MQPITVVPIGISKQLKSRIIFKSFFFSRDGLIRQLEFNGFTKEQAEYGVTKVGY